MTDTYRFQTGFYGLTDMPAEFWNAMDYTLIGLKNTYCFLNDSLIVSKRSEEDHKQHVLNRLKRLDEEDLRINLPKFYFAKLEIDWLGYHIPQSVIFSLLNSLKTVCTVSTLKLSQITELFTQS